ncbi:MAG: hypothetical protein WAW41_11860, partial [Methylobacter sp.]
MHGAIAEKSWMAIPKQIAIITIGLPNKIKCSRPCVLDPGNPCRDDGVTQTLVYNDERLSVGTIYEWAEAIRIDTIEKN